MHKEEEGFRTPVADELLTIKEAAILMGVTARTLHNWLNAGRLRAFSRPPTGRRTTPQLYVLKGEVLAARPR